MHTHAHTHTRTYIRIWGEIISFRNKFICLMINVYLPGYSDWTSCAACLANKTPFFIKSLASSDVIFMYF